MTNIEYYNKYLKGRDFIDGVGNILKFTDILVVNTHNSIDPTVGLIRKFDNKILNYYNVSTCVKFIKENNWKLLPSREDKLKRILND